MDYMLKMKSFALLVLCGIFLFSKLFNLLFIIVINLSIIFNCLSSICFLTVIGKRFFYNSILSLNEFRLLKTHCDMFFLFQ